jgi:sugar phosphate isomerase/epimerase
MKKHENVSRRSFMAFLAALPLVEPLRGLLPHAADDKQHVPVGLELYSVREGLKKDLMGTVRGVAKLGYECVEFYSPYYDWTLDNAKDVRKELDALGVRCYSTHNSPQAFTPEKVSKTVELNQALGARYVVMASAGGVKDVDGWKRVAETLNTANAALASHGLHAGYHNHALEWKPLDGQKPMEVLAANTEKSVVLQLDVGTCLETGNDPVAWVEANPGRIRSMHCKEWSPEKGYRVLFGDGVAPWKKLFAAAESKGGIEYYLIEQEGADYSEMETAERCLAAYRKLRV